MESLSSKIVFASIAFILMIISGIILSRLGHPLNKILFAFHKIFSLATIVLLVMVAISFLKLDERNLKILSLFYVAAGVLLISFISGALLSFEKVMPPFVTIIHRISSVLVVITVLVAGWSMFSGSSY